jgi:CRISPR/Cas system CSM-associated protein Csm3 (group 7 of RAMP superfamily)
MPKNSRGKQFWNPYRWVPASREAVRRAAPLYHHRWQGAAGRLHCTLEALTPLLINDGSGFFLRSKRTGKPFIPGTSLKGVIRSLAELIGNAAQPFRDGKVDTAHALAQASAGEGAAWQLDPVARTFGYLNSGRSFAGLVRFGDAEPVGQVPPALTCTVAVGQPKTTHTPFYPDNRMRKFYHHKVGARTLTGPHPGIRQTNTVHPLPAGVRFGFRADFANFREEELNLLLYTLALEEEVSVKLSKEALGGLEPVTLTGPLRHKLGSCKPQGGGSVRISIQNMEYRADPAARYRGTGISATTFEGDSLREEIARRVGPYVSRTDPTMQHLRAMMIYAEGDPRAADVNYPTYGWFQEEKQDGSGTPLKPTL